MSYITAPRKKVYVTPLGLYYNRVIKGIFNKMPNEIHVILYPKLDEHKTGGTEEESPNGREVTKWARKQQELWKEKVLPKLLGWDAQNTLKLYHWETFEKPEVVFSKLWQLLETIENEGSREGYEVEIWIDTTSSTSVFASMASIVASYFPNTRMCHTHYANAKTPEQYQLEWYEDPGMTPVNIYPAFIGKKRIMKPPMPDILAVLVALDGKATKLKQILKPLSEKDKEWKPQEKGSAIRLARHLRVLERYGILTMTTYAGGRMYLAFTEHGAMVADQIVKPTQKSKDTVTQS